jgi:hypothetical protein
VSSDFSPIVCPLSRVAPIEGADRIRRAEASGYVVVVGANRVEGETGVLFPAGGCLHPEFVEAAGLAHLAGGGRVKEIRLRGVRSEGLWMSWQEFNAALEGCKDVSLRPLAQVQEGPLSITIGGAALLEKYVPRTRYACGERVCKPPKDPRVTRVFPELYETEALFREAREIPVGATCIATLKVHGESFRLANVAASSHPEAPPAGVWVGTRRMDFGPLAELPAREGGLGYLTTLREVFGPRVREGEVVYGEIAGYRVNTGPVMKIAPGNRVKGHPYGANVIFSYGCNAVGPLPNGNGYSAGDRWRPFVYRITQDGRELTRLEIELRCEELKIEAVPLLGTWEHVSVDETRDMSRLRAEGTNGHLPDPLDPRHPMEGVCVRWEKTDYAHAREDGGDWVPIVKVGRAMKAKGWLFRALEGLVKDDGHLEREEEE